MLTLKSNSPVVVTCCFFLRKMPGMSSSILYIVFKDLKQLEKSVAGQPMQTNPMRNTLNGLLRYVIFKTVVTKINK